MAKDRFPIPNPSTNSLPGLVSAILTRVLFMLHGFFAILFVVEKKDDLTQWWPVTFLFCLLIESVYTLLVRRGVEYKYFWPSCFLYIMCVLPSVWIMEIDLFNERLAARDQPLTSVVSNNTNTTDSTNSKNIWDSLSKKTIAENIGALGLVIGIITGRWLLPRGPITRDQLSALLIGYVGIAADILEILELFDENNLMYEQGITMATLSVFSWGLLSFCLVTTATTASEKEEKKNNKVGPAAKVREDSRIKDEYIKQLKEKWRKDMEIRGKGAKLNEGWEVREHLGIKAVKEVFTQSEKRRLDIHGDIYGILTGIFMMDGPFLVFRLYCTVQYDVYNEMHIFYSAKNAISLALLVYRLCILTCKGSDGEDEFYDQRDEDKLRNVQIAIIGTKYMDIRKTQRK